MKKKAALKILAVLLTFVMAASNVFAAAGTPGASTAPTAVSERAGENTAPTIKWKLNNAETAYDTAKGITVTTKEAASAKVIVTYPNTVAVTGASASAAVSGYEPVNSGDYSVLRNTAVKLDSIFGVSETAGNTLTVALAEQTKAVAAKDYTIPAAYLKFWNGTAYTDSAAVSIKITVTEAATEDPTKPEESSSETESSSENPTDPTKPSGGEEESTPAAVDSPDDLDQALDEVLKEIGDVTAEDESAAAKIDAVANALVSGDLGADGLAEQLEENTDVAEKYSDLDEKAVTAKGVTIDNSVAEDVKSLVKEEELQVVGVGLNAEQKSTAGLFISKPEKNETISSSYITSIQLDLKLKINGVERQVKYPITITMPIPGNLSPNRLVVLHYHNGNSSRVKTKIDAKNRTVTFTVTEFSTFVFATQKAGGSSNGGNRRPSGSGSSSATVVNRPNTVVQNVGGWIKSAAGWWYSYGNNTYPKSQWLKLNNMWYFFDGNGYMAEGWKMIDGKWYYLNPSDGNMAEGWKMINGKWYYLNPGSGDMAIGWKQVNGKWYYLDTVNGDCFMNTTTPDGKKVDDTGAWID